MGLLNPKNFFSPFSNKVHLTTILLAGLIIGVLRLSMGKLSLEKASPRNIPAAKAAPLREPLPLNLPRATSQPERQQRERSFPPAVNTLQGLEESSSNRLPEPTATPQVEENRNSAPSLDEIEKELGL